MIVRRDNIIKVVARDTYYWCEKRVKSGYYVEFDGSLDEYKEKIKRPLKQIEFNKYIIECL